MNSVRDLKIVKAEEKIAQTKLREQYEINYINSRKKLGRVLADRLFPVINSRKARKIADAAEKISVSMSSN